MLEIIGVVLGSLGLTFIGSRLIGISVQLLTGGYLRSLIQKITSVPSLVPFWGMVFGLLVQSTNAVIFMAAGLIASEVISFRMGMLLSSWANIGSSLIIFNLIFNSKELAYVLLGIAGFASLFKLPRIAMYFRDLLLGIGLVYLGLNLMIPAIKDLGKLEMLIHFFVRDTTHTIDLFVLGSGVILAFFMQGPTVFLVFALGTAGILNLQECIFFVFGIFIGASISSIFITSQSGPLQSDSMKLSFYRLICALLGTFLFSILIILEVQYHLPFIMNFIETFSSDIQIQLMWVIVLFSFFSTLVTTIFISPIQDLLLRYSPHIKKVDPGKPKYIYKQAITDPHVALDLLDKEGQRLLKMIGSYINSSRNIQIEHIPQPSQVLSGIHSDFSRLANEIEQFQQELSIQNLSEKTAAQFLALVDQHNHILSLEESVYQLSYIIHHCDSSMHNLLMPLIESLDVIYLTALNAIETRDPHEIHFLIEITHDRKALLDSVRDNYLNQVPAEAISVKSSVLVLTSLTERIVWIFRRMGLLLTSKVPL